MDASRETQNRTEDKGEMMKLLDHTELHAKEVGVSSAAVILSPCRGRAETSICSASNKALLSVCRERKALPASSASLRLVCSPNSNGNPERMIHRSKPISTGLTELLWDTILGEAFPPCCYMYLGSRLLLR